MTKVREFAGSATELHALPLPLSSGDAADDIDRGDMGSPEIWVLRPDRAAIVMGSAQREADFDIDALAAADIELAPRRSGGGAVAIDPRSTVWIDLVIPRSSPLFNDDLVVTFIDVGRCWLQALQLFEVDARLVTETPARSPAARLACWAGLGWGEVTVDGHKIVGLSQRRTRWGARVQAMAVLDGRADDVVDWLRLGDRERQELRAEVGSVALDIGATDLETAVISELLALISAAGESK